MAAATNLHAENQSESSYKNATFAGGCFWCMEGPFESTDGVASAVAGYASSAAATKANPTYEEVSSGKSGYVEAIQVTYDPAKISYKQLLDIYWRQIDPTDPGGQFADRGSQYQTAIFYADENEKQIAEGSKKELAASGKFKKPIATEIRPLSSFYPAEDYHQDYYKKQSQKYKTYKTLSGRETFLEKLWGKLNPSASHEPAPAPSRYCKLPPAELKEKLTPLQYDVTQQCSTEPPFQNEYWDNKREGIYVDVATGEPLFSSLDKFDSGTGWPSFTKPLEPLNIVEQEDDSALMSRIEVKSKIGDSHLGHVFPDGPEGLRYCINSASLKFIPKEDLEKEGYSEYQKLFEKSGK